MWTSSMLLGGRRPPFSLSGTFATDLEDWSQTGGTVSWSSSSFRTSPGALIVSPGSAMEYVIDKSVCGGLTITASIWHTTGGISVSRTLSYKIGSGSFVTLDTVTNASTTYAQLSGSFENPGYNDVTIKLATSTGTNVAADDWSISGV